MEIQAAASEEGSTRFFTSRMLPRLLTGALLLAQLFSESRAAERTAPQPERFEERLRLTPFAEGKVLSEFGFVLEGPWRDEGVHLAGNVLCKYERLVC